MKSFAQLLSVFFAGDNGDQDKFIKNQNQYSNQLGHKSTPSSHGGGGRGITKKFHEESKVRRKMAAQSRKINRSRK